MDKRSGKEEYLDGSWAEMFQEQILAWQRDTPPKKKWKMRWTAMRAWHKTLSWCTDSAARGAGAQPLSLSGATACGG